MPIRNGVVSTQYCLPDLLLEVDMELGFSGKGKLIVYGSDKVVGDGGGLGFPTQ